MNVREVNHLWKPLISPLEHFLPELPNGADVCSRLAQRYHASNTVNNEMAHARSIRKLELSTAYQNLLLSSLSLL